jgi:hypothetical protein
MYVRADLLGLEIVELDVACCVHSPSQEELPSYARSHQISALSVHEEEKCHVPTRVWVREHRRRNIHWSKFSDLPSAHCSGICWYAIPALINIYYIHLSLSIFLTVYPFFAFGKYTGTSKFPFRSLDVLMSTICFTETSHLASVFYPG